MSPEEKKVVASQFAELKGAVENLDKRIHQLTNAFKIRQEHSERRISDLEDENVSFGKKLDGLASQSEHILRAVTNLDKRIWSQAEHNFDQQKELGKLTAKHSGAGALGGGVAVGLFELIKLYLSK